MPYIAAVTQSSWINVLQTYGYDDEVNFWRPGRQGISSNLIGSYMVFIRKGKSPRKVMGFGKIKGFELLTIREAWQRWNVKNGVLSLTEFVNSVARVAEMTSTNGGGLRNVISGEQSVIGCAILTDVSLFSEERAPISDLVLPGFPKNVVSYKKYPESFPPMLQGLVAQASSSEAVYPLRLEAPDPVKIVAIDRCAMATVRAFFVGFNIVDVSTPIRAYETVGAYHPGYDLLVRGLPDEYHVEVKGTTLQRPLVKVTRNEMLNALNDACARLAVVSNIGLRQESSEWKATGGVTGIYKWVNIERLREIVHSIGAFWDQGLGCKVDEWTVDVEHCAYLELVTRSVVQPNGMNPV
jgi:hypothetical protein